MPNRTRARPPARGAGVENPSACSDVSGESSPTSVCEGSTSDQLRSRGSDRDVHLVGGPQTIRAFAALGALHRLEILVLPVLLGDGIPLSPRHAPRLPLRLLRADRVFPDGTAELVYALSGPAPG